MQLLSIDDMVRELGLSRKTIYKLINDGGFDRYVSRIGGRYFTTEERLKQYVDDMVISKSDGTGRA